jgi:hypothetical protein
LVLLEDCLPPGFLLDDEDFGVELLLDFPLSELEFSSDFDFSSDLDFPLSLPDLLLLDDVC